MGLEPTTFSLGSLHSERIRTKAANLWSLVAPLLGWRFLRRLSRLWLVVEGQLGQVHVQGGLFVVGVNSEGQELQPLSFLFGVLRSPQGRAEPGVELGFEPAYAGRWRGGGRVVRVRVRLEPTRTLLVAASFCPGRRRNLAAVPSWRLSRPCPAPIS